MDYLTLSSRNVPSCADQSLTAVINRANGQLVSLKMFNEEYMHCGGRALDDPCVVQSQREVVGRNPSWPNSEIVMFPIVNSSLDNTVTYNGKKFPLDQHGIVRAMTPEIVHDSSQPEKATVLWKYLAETQVDNSARSALKPESPAHMQLPFSFELIKTFVINDTSLRTTLLVRNTGDNAFSYALGWHPAFTSQGNSYAQIFYDSEDKEIITLEDLARMETGLAKILLGETNVLHDNTFTSRRLIVRGALGSTMLWSPNSGMFCIEPITEKAEKGTPVDLSVSGTYKNSLKPGEQKEWTVEIIPCSLRLRSPR